MNVQLEIKNTQVEWKIGISQHTLLCGMPANPI